MLSCCSCLVCCLKCSSVFPRLSHKLLLILQGPAQVTLLWKALLDSLRQVTFLSCCPGLELRPPAAPAWVPSHTLSSATGTLQPAAQGDLVWPLPLGWAPCFPGLSQSLNVCPAQPPFLGSCFSGCPRATLDVGEPWGYQPCPHPPCLLPHWVPSGWQDGTASPLCMSAEIILDKVTAQALEPLLPVKQLSLNPEGTRKGVLWTALLHLIRFFPNTTERGKFLGAFCCRVWPPAPRRGLPTLLRRPSQKLTSAD